MPVSYPVVERIARELYRRLLTMINSQDYQTKVREVIRPKRLNEYSPGHLQIVMAEGESEVVDELTYPGNPPSIAHQQTFNLHLHLMPSESSCTAIDDDVNRFAADVIQAVTSESSWYTFDQNAIDAAWRAKIAIGSDGGLDGVTLPLDVIYRVKENNPYEARN